MSLKDTLFSVKQTINCGGVLIDLSIPRVMGILNITPDSFYDGGRYKNEKDILDRVEQMLSEGADIIDIGACSTRPGSAGITIEEEMQRLKSALVPVRSRFHSAVISIDTYRSEIAEYTVKEFGAGMINDISAGTLDENMFSTVGKLNVPYVLMHMKGTPQNMQVNPVYDDVVKEITAFFSEKTEMLKTAGVNDIIIDPGFGFGKSPTDNFRILNQLGIFRLSGFPVMAGLSRKSMVYRSIGKTPDEALNGTVVLETLALNNGASFLRVHDVKQAIEAVKLVSLYRSKA
ncbi:MAG TPA: dihydropteroate synthase [Bacteroidales bacterium]|nr:dihydropteroate synthase [Bacteroidales bacterium]